MFINKYNLTILIMIQTIKVSSRGQVVIPEEMRNHLNIKEGTKLVTIEREGKIVMEPEESFLQKIQQSEGLKEKKGWLLVAEKSLSPWWDTPEEEKEWSKYA